MERPIRKVASRNMKSHIFQGVSSILELDLEQDDIFFGYISFFLVGTTKFTLNRMINGGVTSDQECMTFDDVTRTCFRDTFQHIKYKFPHDDQSVNL